MAKSSWASDTESISSWSWSNGLSYRSCDCSSLWLSSVDIDSRGDTSSRLRTTSTVSRGCRWDSGPFPIGRVDPGDGAFGVSPIMNVGSPVFLGLVLMGCRCCAYPINARWERPFAAVIRQFSKRLVRTLRSTRRSSFNISLRIDGFRTKT